MTKETFRQKDINVSTVGLHNQTIKKYIQEQEIEDKVADSRNIKEYKDPFQG